MIDSELDLVAILRHSCGERHNSCVAHEDIQAVGLCFDGSGAFLDGGERRMVASDESYRHDWRALLDLLDEAVCRIGIAATEEDVSRIVLRKACDSTLAKACCASCDEDDLAGKIWDVFGWVESSSCHYEECPQENFEKAFSEYEARMVLNSALFEVPCADVQSKVESIYVLVLHPFVFMSTRPTIMPTKECKSCKI